VNKLLVSLFAGCVLVATVYADHHESAGPTTIPTTREVAAEAVDAVMGKDESAHKSDAAAYIEEKKKRAAAEKAEGPEKASKSDESPDRSQREEQAVAADKAEPTEKPAPNGAEVLKYFVGTFEVTGKTRNTPDEEFTSYTGKEVGELVLNKQYVQSVGYLEKPDGAQVSWISFVTYEPAGKRYSFVAMNDSGAYISYGTGTVSDEPNTLLVTERDNLYRVHLQFSDEGYTTRFEVPQGAEWVVVTEETYKRVKE
jgi:hypothetical protein